jgi:hypothetical protein
VLIRGEECRRELTAINPVGLVAVHDVGQELYYSLWVLWVCWGVLLLVQEVGDSKGLVHILPGSGHI